MIVIAFYVVPFITSRGREGEKGSVHYGVLFCFLLVFFFVVLLLCEFFIICAVIFLLKNVCFVCYTIFVFFFFWYFSWHFSLAFGARSGAIGFNLSLLILNAIFN